MNKNISLLLALTTTVPAAAAPLVAHEGTSVPSVNAIGFSAAPAALTAPGMAAGVLNSFTPAMSAALPAAAPALAAEPIADPAEVSGRAAETGAALAAQVAPIQKAVADGGLQTDAALGAFFGEGRRSNDAVESRAAKDALTEASLPGDYHMVMSDGNDVTKTSLAVRSDKKFMHSGVDAGQRWSAEGTWTFANGVFRGQGRMTTPLQQPYFLELDLSGQTIGSLRAGASIKAKAGLSDKPGESSTAELTITRDADAPPAKPLTAAVSESRIVIHFREAEDYGSPHHDSQESAARSARESYLKEHGYDILWTYDAERSIPYTYLLQIPSTKTSQEALAELEQAFKGFGYPQSLESPAPAPGEVKILIEVFAHKFEISELMRQIEGYGFRPATKLIGVSYHRWIVFGSAPSSALDKILSTHNVSQVPLPSK